MLLDTSAYSAYVDGSAAVFQRLDETLSVSFPLAVIAEIRKGFLGGTRRQENETILQGFMQMTGAEIVLPTIETADYFAELWMFCRKKGRVLSDNDLWIATTALETGETLLTLDKDFVVFDGYEGLAIIVL